MKRLEEVSINNNPSVWDKATNLSITKISFLNTRSLVNKFENIRSDSSLQQSNIMILAETWISKTTDKRKYELEEFEDHLNNSGRGKGLAIFFKQEFQHICDLNEDHISITKMGSKDIDIIAIYRSKDGILTKLVNNLQDLINFSKTTLVIGDINICSSEKPNNQLKIFLQDMKFKQIVNQATHIDGGHIDHCYFKNMGNYEEVPVVEIIPKYYSDHEAIYIALKKIPDQL